MSSPSWAQRPQRPVKTHPRAPNTAQEASSCRFGTVWDRVGAVLGCFGTVLGLLLLMCWGGAISRAAAVFYYTAAAWTELEMLPKGVQLCFLFAFVHDLLFQH
jgi:hypothetical protein